MRQEQDDSEELVETKQQKGSKSDSQTAKADQAEEKNFEENENGRNRKTFSQERAFQFNEST